MNFYDEREGVMEVFDRESLTLREVRSLTYSPTKQKQKKERERA